MWISPDGGANPPEPASVNDEPPFVEKPKPVMLLTPPQPLAANCRESFHPTTTAPEVAAALGSFSVVSLSSVLELLSLEFTCTLVGGGVGGGTGSAAGLTGTSFSSLAAATATRLTLAETPRFALSEGRAVRAAPVIPGRLCALSSTEIRMIVVKRVASFLIMVASPIGGNGVIEVKPIYAGRFFGSLSGCGRCF
jgi:hypothetical protein